MKKIALLGMLGIGMSNTVFAETGITAASGMYLSGQAGWAFVDNSTVTTASNAADNISFNQANSSYLLGISTGYNFALNPRLLLGAELGYLNLGQYQYTLPFDLGSSTVNNWGVQTLITTTFIAPNGFNLFVKGGGIYEDEHFSTTILGTRYSQNTHGILPAAMIGVGYLITSCLDLTLQYERTFGSNWNNAGATSDPTPMSLNMVSVGLTGMGPM